MGGSSSVVLSNAPSHCSDAGFEMELSISPPSNSITSQLCSPCCNESSAKAVAPSLECFSQELLDMSKRGTGLWSVAPYTEVRDLNKGPCMAVQAPTVRGAVTSVSAAAETSISFQMFDSYERKTATDTAHKVVEPPLTVRAKAIIAFVENLLQRHESRRSPLSFSLSESELAIVDIFIGLNRSPIGLLFQSHPEVYLSNRASVIVTPQFQPQETVGVYQLQGAYNPGTIGRSYFATKGPRKSTVTGSNRASDTVRDARISGKQSGHLKVVSFVLRPALFNAVVAEQRTLASRRYDNILRITDVLDDERQENIIVITKLHPFGNICCYAGKLGHQPDKLRRILLDIGNGLRVLHSMHIYHHNLKLENILETGRGGYCIADAGFSKLFLSQCPEALVFNGELACLPPEVFDVNGRYATGGVNDVVGPQKKRVTTSLNGGAPLSSHKRDNGSGAEKADIWGFGIIVYRLAYGEEPVVIAEHSCGEVMYRVKNLKLTFPKHPWSFSAILEDVITWCLKTDPRDRPTIGQLLRHPLFRGFGPHASSTLMNVSRGTRPSSMTVSPLTMSLSRSVLHSSGYIIDSQLGRGRFSVTSIARFRHNSGRVFAYKAMHNSILARIQSIEASAGRHDIRKQIAICRKIRHLNLMQYFDIVDNKNGCFIGQPYRPMGSLEASLSAVCSSDAPCFRKLLGSMLMGLSYLHKNGVASLSITPSNIFYSKDVETFQLADFGPMFITVDEILQAAACGKPVYSLPPRIERQMPLDSPKGRSLDCFCVGLLAASAVPALSEKVWRQLKCEPNVGPLSIEEILETIRSPAYALSQQLILFIEAALCTNATADDLLLHAYLSDVVPSRVVLPPVEVSTDEVACAMESQARMREENRLYAVVGQNFLHDSWMNISTMDYSGLSHGALSAAGPTRGEVGVSLSLPGHKVVCGKCGTDLPIALYLCLECDAYIRCAKCSVGDNHQAGHQLLPYVVHTIEHGGDSSDCTQVVSLSCVGDSHAVEALEMGANLPVGSLTSYLDAHRAMERSSRGSLRKAYASGLSNSEVKCSSILSGGRNATSMTPLSYNMSLSGLLSSSSRHTLNMTVSATASAAPKGRDLFRQDKRQSLPKADEIEGEVSYCQEIKMCREDNRAELLLFSFKLSEVPHEIYTPPLLQVVLLDLSQNELRTLPSELSYLVHLRKLVLSYNSLTKLPESLGNLSELETLDCSHNQLDDLPRTFMCLHKLVSIALDYNKFKGIPECILDIRPPPMESPLRLNSDGGVPTIPGYVPETSKDLLSDDTSLSSTVCCSASPALLRSPSLNVIYMAANDSLLGLPDPERLRRFESLKIALDNEPHLYRHFMANNMEKVMPNVTVLWNKIFPDEIVPNLYCGSLRSAQSQTVYKKLNIACVLTVGRGLAPVPPEGGTHSIIIVDDIPGAQLKPSFTEAVDFIDKSIKAGKGCLVHCFAGLSRSATTVIAYLMMRRGMRMDEAYLLTKKGRPAILPNAGFLQQLVQLDTELYPGARPLDMQSLGRPSEGE